MKRILIFAFICGMIIVGCNTNRSFTINIKSEPSSAVVYVDGECKGETPLGIELKAGNYDITLLKEGFTALKEKITVNKENLSFSFALKGIAVKETLPFSGSINSTVSSNQRLMIAESVAGDTKLHCVDTLSHKELWNYTIQGNPDINLRIIDNLLFAFSENPPLFYIFNFDGNLLRSYKELPFSSFTDFDKDIVAMHDFSSINPNYTSIMCYSLSSGKIIWEKDINLKNAILLSLNPHSNFIYLFGMSGDFVVLYKLTKLDGDTTLICDFNQIHGSMVPATGWTFPAILGTFQDKALLLSDNSKIYCIDQNLGTIYFSVDSGIQITGWKIIDKYLFVSSNASNKTVSIDLENGKITGIYNTSFSNLQEYLGSQIAYDVKNKKVFVSDSYGKIHLYTIEGKELSFNYEPCASFSVKKIDYTSLRIVNGILFVEIHYLEDSVENRVNVVSYNAQTLTPLFRTNYEIYTDDNCMFYISPSQNMLIFMDVQNIE